MDFITHDRTFKVGDLVFSTYHKGELLFKITKVERRFLNKNDLRYQVYQGGSVGDEYNSYFTIESVANLSITADPTKKFRKTVKGLDGAWLKKATPEHIEAHVKKLSLLLGELWP